MSTDPNHRRWPTQDDPVVMHLPESTEFVWQRLSDLAGFSWPTLAEQIERKMLVEWLRPGSIVSEIVLFETIEVYCNETLHLDGKSEDLNGLLAVIPEVRNKLQRLGRGEQLEPVRPQPPQDQGEGDNARYDEWRAARQTQAQEWFASVMATLGQLLASQAVGDFDLIAAILPELRNELRTDIVQELIADSYAIGVTMARETWYGEGEIVLHVSTTLAQVMKLLLEKLSSDDGSEAARLIASLDFFAQQLKGYLWAYSRIAGDNNQLTKLYATRPDDWNLVKATLSSSAAVLHDRRSEGAIAWPEFAHSCGRKAAMLPTSELISLLETRIAEAALWIEVFRSSR